MGNLFECLSNYKYFMKDSASCALVCALVTYDECSTSCKLRTCPWVNYELRWLVKKFPELFGTDCLVHHDFLPHGERVLLIISTRKSCRYSAMRSGGSSTASGKDSGFCITKTYRATHHLLCSNSLPRKTFLSIPRLLERDCSHLVQSRASLWKETNIQTPLSPLLVLCTQTNSAYLVQLSWLT
jgi:hypothetical protein